MGHGAKGMGQRENMSTDLISSHLPLLSAPCPLPHALCPLPLYRDNGFLLEE